MAETPLGIEELTTENERLKDEVAGLRNRIEFAIKYAIDYGWIEGDHHRAWTIDQMLRTLAGDDYEALIAPKDGETEWDTGTKP